MITLGKPLFFLVNSGLVSMTLSLYWFIHVENSSIQPMMTVTPSPCLVFTSPNYSWGDHKNRFFPLSIGNCPSYFRRVTRKPVNQIPELCWLIPPFFLSSEVSLGDHSPRKNAGNALRMLWLGFATGWHHREREEWHRCAGTVSSAAAPMASEACWALFSRMVTLETKWEYEHLASDLICVHLICPIYFLDYIIEVFLQKQQKLLLNCWI